MEPRTFAPTVTDGPEVEPLTVAEARLWLRIDNTVDDTTIARKITAARQIGEAHTGRAWITQTLAWKLPQWPADDELVLPKPPFQGLEKIEYYDVDGVLRTFASSNYFEVADLNEGLVTLKPAAVWPELQDGRPDPIVVTFLAGYGDEVGDIPGPYRSGFELLLTHLMRNRSQEETGTNIVPLVFGLEDCWAVDRVIPV